MAYFLAPIGNSQIIDANGDPLVGGTISTFLAGTSTASTTYTDDTGGTPQGVVMTLNSLGYPTNGPVWMLGGVPLKFIIKNAAGVTQSTFDDVSGIGDTTTVQDQWVLYGAAPTYISATSFSVAGDQTNTFQVYRRLKSTNTGGTVYSTIVSSSFAASVTTVTVVNTSGTLDSGLSQVSYGLISSVNDSTPRNLQPTSFRADNNSVNIVIPTITWTRVAFSTERHDTNSEFASGTFTAKKAGVHRFHAQWSGAAPLAGNAMRVRIYKNGVENAEGRLILASGNQEIVQVDADILLAVGDTVDMYVYHDRGTNQDLFADSSFSYFCGGFLGA